jgi:16S rRNA processing protein RimM
VDSVVESGNPGIAVGRILAPHGVAGFLKAQPLTDFPERCERLTEVVVELKSSRRSLTVEKAALHGRLWLIKFDEIGSREEAAALRGGCILIPPEERVPLPTGYYYYDQLVGLMVYNTGGECLGQLQEIIPGAAHDLYLVQGEGLSPKEFLLPAVKEFILKIDLPGGKIIADPPEGLLEL